MLSKEKIIISTKTRIKFNGKLNITKKNNKCVII